MDIAGLRRAKTSDAAAVHSLMQVAYGHYVERIGAPPAPMLDDYARVIAEHETWVVEDGGVTAAMVLVPRADHLLVENVAVAPGAQGRGLGRALLALAAERCRARGLAEMRLYTHEKMTENIALYQRLGWEETGRGKQAGYERVFFRKPV